MPNFSTIYKELISSKNIVKNTEIRKGKFYLLKEYNYSDGEKSKFTETTAPIIFTLYVSKAKDIVHAVKVSDVNPAIIAGMFQKLIDEETNTLKLKGKAKQIYDKVISKAPTVSDEAYRTYKLSGMNKLIELKMDVDKIFKHKKAKKDKEK